jgi:hypothetical protein
LAKTVEVKLVLSKADVKRLAEELEWLCTTTESKATRMMAARASAQLFAQQGFEKTATQIRKTHGVDDEE